MPLIDIARILFALIAVVGMIGIVAIGAKKLGLQNGALSFQRARRLALVETMNLDQRRRAAILRCDDREHLIVFDAGRITVIEQGIPRREIADDADPIAAAAATAPSRKLQVPAPVVRLLQRVPRDETRAFRAAGIL